MILKLLALAALATVLIAKYLTSTHMAALRQQLSELATEHTRCRGKNQLVLERIDEAQTKEHDLKNLIHTLEHQLDSVDRELMEKEARNRDLQEMVDL